MSLAIGGGGGVGYGAKGNAVNGLRVLFLHWWRCLFILLLLLLGVVYLSFFVLYYGRGMGGYRNKNLANRNKIPTFIVTNRNNFNQS